jgi:HEAT repeat protein
MKTSIKTIGLLSALAMGLTSPLFSQVPDLTAAGAIAALKTDPNSKPVYGQTYNLGATGLRGWIYNWEASNHERAQGRTTQASRQILVTHVGAASPADGVVKVDDVILGVDGKPFSDDARKSIALAIQEAETKARDGVLKLTVWRAGQTQDLSLKLAVMGTYSDTAPYKCDKSKLILENAIKVLAKEEMEPNWAGSIQGLALLATGKPEYLPKLREFARRLSKLEVDPDMKPTKTYDAVWGSSWNMGYNTVFLCEYYMVTRDQEILPTIKNNALSLARGQSAYGTFGHGYASLTKDRKFNGSVPPYGPVNMAGLPANLGIVLAKKCGVKHLEIDQAIIRAAGFFGYFTGKGSIPYGEHAPGFSYHENNGMNAITAVLFASMGDKPKDTEYFARMATAAYPNREFGHTGQGFAYLWSALGAAVGGPESAAEFFRKSSWHYDLVRRSDGSFTYDGDEQYGAGKTDDNTYFGNSSYNGLSPAASYVLTYSLPLKKLVITGRDANPKGWLSKQEAAVTVAAGHFDLDRRSMSPAELITAFGIWSPIVRGWAAQELATRPESKTMVPELIKLAESGDPHQIQAACEALGLINTAEALPVLVKQLAHPDRCVRYKAAEAVKKMGETAKPAIEDILKALVATAEPSWPIRWEDPVQVAHGQLAAAVFSGPLNEELNKVDPKLRNQAIRSVSTNPDGWARAQLEHFFQNQLTERDVIELAPAILAAVESSSPADTMFNNVIRMAGLQALTKYHFKEGIAAAVGLAFTQGGHASESRTGEIMKMITGYGSAAKPQIPALKELIASLNAEVENREFPGDLNNQRVGAVEEAIKAIEAAKDHPPLRSTTSASAK